MNKIKSDLFYSYILLLSFCHSLVSCAGYVGNNVLYIHINSPVLQMFLNISFR